MAVQAASRGSCLICGATVSSKGKIEQARIDIMFLCDKREYNFVTGMVMGRQLIYPIVIYFIYFSDLVDDDTLLIPKIGLPYHSYYFSKKDSFSLYESESLCSLTSGNKNTSRSSPADEPVPLHARSRSSFFH
jgi:hypothetical protein